MLTNIQIEELEYKYLNRIHSMLQAHQDNMIKNLESMNTIIDYWRDVPHDQGYDSGAERVIYSILTRGGDLGEPNSCPVASDLFFENNEAFIHIDLKSAQPVNNLTDHWRTPVGKNQTSYNHSIKTQRSEALREFNPSLPHYYGNKVTLTFFITILYDKIEKNFRVVNINVSSMPNGQLSSEYGYDVLSPGKNPHDDKARFTMNKCFQFRNLNDENKKRVLVTYLNRDVLNQKFRTPFEKFLSSINYS